MHLETERLILREFVYDDWPAVLAYQSDPRYLRVYGMVGRSAGEAQDFVRQLLAHQEERPRYRYQLAIALKGDQRLIGNCGLRKEAPDSRVANIGYELNPDYWGRGYAGEATGRLVAYGFERLGLRRVWARTTSGNRASRRVLEKLGLRLEGRMRQHEYVNGMWDDRLIYGILANEWLSMRSPTTGDGKHIV